MTDSHDAPAEARPEPQAARPDPAAFQLRGDPPRVMRLSRKALAIVGIAAGLGIGGAIQALLTPDLGIYGFPHFRFFQTFLSHGLIVTSGIYMTVVEGFRPTWKSILRVTIWMNIYVVIVYFINIAIGSNYLMINYKPNTPSLLDLLPDWPLYVLYMEIIGFVTCLLLYLPFAIRDWRDKYRTDKDNTSRLESISN